MTRAVMLSMLALALAGCPKGGGKGPVEPGEGGRTQKRDAGAVASGTGSDAGVPCAQESRCMFHPGAGAYFTCYSAADGACAHFGPTCAPADGCLFDPDKNAYRKCERVVMGRCASGLGEACIPESRCMLDREAGITRTCTQPTGDGTCAAFADPC